MLWSSIKTPISCQNVVGFFGITGAKGRLAVYKKEEGIMDSTYQFVIVIVVVVGVIFLTYAEKLRAQDATTLLGLIVRYLLGKGAG
jgi:hypothetical protein